MPQRPREYDCSACGNGPLSDSDIDRVVSVTSSPGDVGASKEETWLCEECSAKYAKINAQFGFQPVSEDSGVILF